MFSLSSLGLISLLSAHCLSCTLGLGVPRQTEASLRESSPSRARGWRCALGAVLSAPVGFLLRPHVLCLWAGLILRGSTPCPVAEASTFMAPPAPRVLTQSH